MEILRFLENSGIKEFPGFFVQVYNSFFGKELVCTTFYGDIPASPDRGERDIIGDPIRLNGHFCFITRFLLLVELLGTQLFWRCILIRFFKEYGPVSC